jgi:hypothetical protein
MPRSPSRDLADRYLGNRGYFRRFNRLERWKWGLSFLALVAAGVYVAAGYVNRKAGDYRLTHGPLTNVHATWDNDCAVCHKPAGEVDAGLLRADQRWAALTCDKCHAGPRHYERQTEARMLNDCAACHHDHLGRSNSLVHISDAHCTSKCHNNSEFLASIQNKKKNGERLEAIADFTAAGGHPNMRVLDAETKPDRGPKHKRGLKFSHALHMMPGLKPPKGGALATYGTYKNQSGGQRLEQYATIPNPNPVPTIPEADQRLIQLDCAACHQTDSGLLDKDIARPSPVRAGNKGQADALEELLAGQPRYGVRPPRMPGDIFLPINYDLHCKTCHPNMVPGASVTVDNEAVATYSLSEFSNMHRFQPKDLYQRIEREYIGILAGNILRDGKLTDKARRQLEELDAQRTDQEKRSRGLDARPRRPAEKKAGTAPPAPEPKVSVEEATLKARDLALRWAKMTLTPPDPFPPTGSSVGITATCAKCHDVKNPPPPPPWTGPGTAAQQNAYQPQVETAEIEPTNTPSVWFANSKFNHAAHRGTTCVSCHIGTQMEVAQYQALVAGKDDEKAIAAFRATEKSNPKDHLPDIDACRTCHGPAGTKDGQPVGGVRYGCTECHRYHNGEHPLQGRGAKSRNPDEKAQYKTFSEFLGGKPAGKTP